MPDQMQAVRDALARLTEDLELLDGIPVRDTQSARTERESMRLAVHERFSLKVQDVLGEPSSGEAG